MSGYGERAEKQLPDKQAEREDKQSPDRQNGREADRQTQIDRKSKIDCEKDRGHDRQIKIKLYMHRGETAGIQQECSPQRTKTCHL
jgi:hypothetical protein